MEDLIQITKISLLNKVRQFNPQSIISFYQEDNMMYCKFFDQENNIRTMMEIIPYYEASKRIQKAKEVLSGK